MMTMMKMVTMMTMMILLTLTWQPGSGELNIRPWARRPPPKTSRGQNWLLQSPEIKNHLKTTRFLPNWKHTWLEISWLSGLYTSWEEGCVGLYKVHSRWPRYFLRLERCLKVKPEGHLEDPGKSSSIRIKCRLGLSKINFKSWQKWTRIQTYQLSKQTKCWGVEIGCRHQWVENSPCHCYSTAITVVLSI